MSIYQALFPYRASGARRPREDFLSAALADLLNRLPLAEYHAFVCGVLLEKETAAYWMHTCGETARKLRWKTQRTLHPFADVAMGRVAQAMS